MVRNAMVGRRTAVESVPKGRTRTRSPGGLGSIVEFQVGTVVVRDPGIAAYVSRCSRRWLNREGDCGTKRISRAKDNVNRTGNGGCPAREKRLSRMKCWKAESAWARREKSGVEGTRRY